MTPFANKLTDTALKKVLSIVKFERTNWSEITFGSNTAALCKKNPKPTPQAAAVMR